MRIARVDRVSRGSVAVFVVSLLAFVTTITLLLKTLGVL